MTLTASASFALDHLDVSAADVGRVQRLLASGAVKWVVLSGKMCSGKDTVAQALPFEFERASIGDLVRADYGRGIHVAQAYLDGVDERVAIAVISHVMDLPWERATDYLERTAADLRANPGHHAGSRTDNSRYITQELGSAWRTDEDPYYWAAPSAMRSMESLLAGRNVVATSARYVPDVDLPRALGATIVRLDITPATQARRLMSRDGLRPDPEMVSHPSEMALDDYDFDVRLDANADGPGSAEGLAARIMAALR